MTHVSTDSLTAPQVNRASVGCFSLKTCKDTHTHTASATSPQRSRFTSNLHTHLYTQHWEPYFTSLCKSLEMGMERRNSHLGIREQAILFSSQGVGNDRREGKVGEAGVYSHSPSYLMSRKHLLSAGLWAWYSEHKVKRMWSLPLRCRRHTSK